MSNEEEIRRLAIRLIKATRESPADALAVAEVAEKVLAIACATTALHLTVNGQDAMARDVPKEFARIFHIRCLEVYEDTLRKFNAFSNNNFISSFDPNAELRKELLRLEEQRD